MLKTTSKILAILTVQIGIKTAGAVQLEKGKFKDRMKQFGQNVRDVTEDFLTDERVINGAQQVLNNNGGLSGVVQGLQND